MIGDILQPTHLLFILIVALLVLGPKRLPELAKTLGSGLRDFRAAINGERDELRDSTGVDALRDFKATITGEGDQRGTPDPSRSQEPELDSQPTAGSPENTEPAGQPDPVSSVQHPD